jgi:hypothetical protein
LGENRRVLNDPSLRERALLTRFSELLHGAPCRLVINSPKVFNEQGVRVIHKRIKTFS